MSSLRIALAASLLLAPAFQGCATVRAADLYRSGTVALEEGNAARAIQDLEAAAARLPEASEIQNHLGLAYEAAGREGDALAAFRRAVELDCDNQPAQHNLGLAEAREGRRRGASSAR